MLMTPSFQLYQNLLESALKTFSSEIASILCNIIQYTIYIHFMYCAFSSWIFILLEAYLFWKAQIQKVKGEKIRCCRFSDRITKYTAILNSICQRTGPFITAVIVDTVVHYTCLNSLYGSITTAVTAATSMIPGIKEVDSGTLKACYSSKRYLKAYVQF